MFGGSPHFLFVLCMPSTYAIAYSDGGMVASYRECLFIHKSSRIYQQKTPISHLYERYEYLCHLQRSDPWSTTKCTHFKGCLCICISVSTFKKILIAL